MLAPNIYHYLEDEGLFISTKKDEKKTKKKQPPKIRGKHFHNLEYLAGADLICLTPEMNNSFPSPTYNKSIDHSYFDQCFLNIAKLGDGDCGSVAKVVSREDSKFYAVKISKEPFKSDYHRFRKLHELTYHTKFSEHPNVVTLHEAWEEDRHVYLKMELCKSDLVRTKVMPEHQCWDVLCDITQALDFIHQSEIGHFDVKLENILLAYDGLYKLCDFGLMYSCKKDLGFDPREGDAKYVAPELLGIETNFTTKADIFSLGICILELAGNLKLPNNGPIWRALRDNKIPFELTKHISNELLHVITSMMTADYKKRPSAADILNMPAVRAVMEKKRAALCNPTTKVCSSTMHLLPCKAAWTLLSQLVQLVASHLFQRKDKLSVTIHGQSLMSPALDSSTSSYKSTVTRTNDPKVMREKRLAVKRNIFTTEMNGSVSSLDSPISDSRNQLFMEEPSCVKLRDPENSSSLESLLYTNSLYSPSCSPIHLSHELKEVVRARKRQRTLAMEPRNLMAKFNSPN